MRAGGRRRPSAPPAAGAPPRVALVVDASRIAVSLRTARAYKSAALRSNAFHFAGDMAGSLAVLESAAWIGIYGVSFVTVLAGSLPALLHRGGEPVAPHAPNTSRDWL